MSWLGKTCFFSLLWGFVRTRWGQKHTYGVQKPSVYIQLFKGKENSRERNRSLVFNVKMTLAPPGTLWAYE